MIHQIYGVYRPFIASTVDMPLGASSVGYYKVFSGFKEKVVIGDCVQIFWGIKGSGIIVVNRKEFHVGENQIMVCYPQSRYSIACRDESWEYRWWIMDGPMVTSIVTAFGFMKTDIYDTGRAPEECFEKMERAIRNVTPFGERRAGSLAYELLANAAGGMNKSRLSREIQDTIDIIHRNWNDRDLSVDMLARHVNFHRSTFSKHFHETMGVSPAEYIANLRIQNALSMLKHTKTPVKEIAYLCGWDDPNYFSRCIRIATGMSPGVFRKN